MRCTTANDIYRPILKAVSDVNSTRQKWSRRYRVNSFRRWRWRVSDFVSCLFCNQWRPYVRAYQFGSSDVLAFVIIFLMFSLSVFMKKWRPVFGFRLFDGFSLAKVFLIWRFGGFWVKVWSTLRTFRFLSLSISAWNLEHFFLFVVIRLM